MADLGQWQELSFSRKTYIVSLIFALASPFLPWFSDISAVGGGKVYLGLAGPTAYIGVSIFLVALLAGLKELFFVMKGKHLFGENLTRIVYRGAGFFMIYNLLIAFSIFQDPLIGESALNKELSWGFFTALVAYLGVSLSVFFKLENQQKPADIRRSAIMNRPVERNARPIRTHTIDLQNDLADLRNLRVGDVSPVTAGTETRQFKKQWEQQKVLEAKLNSNDQEKYF